ncbi:DUF7286 family protein [Haloparvum sedimenti]|uniref:DUF7286 family protein n=1 Tax=Haloparvum sedimenti TaxID=1678448 RepID=UPI00071E6DAE|nr:hypothetical protein [Haloparvum sedimenti]
MRRPATVRLADDDRARVPFALIGVLLLVSSVAYAGALQQQGRVAVDDSVERAVERAAADATPAVRAGVGDAARDAAAEPVTAASTADGRNESSTPAVRPESSFSDALRIRIAVEVSRSLPTTERRVDDVRAVTEVPDVRDETDLIAARERVSVSPVANGTALRATVRNVTTIASRDGRTVARRTRNVTVVVPVPVFAAHERTERFEEQLNRGALEGPGLGRQLTARLYPVTWARGYAQHGGAPVQNVLANRHVELSTNAGIVRVQRNVFGGTDPRAKAGVRRATARTGVADLLAPTELDEEEWSRAVVGDSATGSEREIGTGTDGDQVPDGLEGANRTRTVEVGAVADTAFLSTIAERDAIARDAYRASATLRTDSTLRTDTTTRDGPTTDAPPAGNWTLADTQRERTVAVDEARDGVGPSGGSDGFGTTHRVVRTVDETTWTWTNGTVTRTGREVRTREYRVEIRVEGTYAPTAGAPERPTAPTFERGGALDGPNLADVPATARADLAAATDDELSRIARQAVVDGAVARETTVVGARPDRLAPHVEADLAELHREVSKLSTTVSMREVAAGEADPYGELAVALRERRAELVDAPATYDGAADRARVAARAAYVDAVIAALERRSTADDEVSAAVGDAAGDDATLDADTFGAYLDARTAAERGVRRSIGDGGPGGGVDLAPRGSPGYLPRTAVDGAAIEGVATDARTRPLATRNRNLVTLPYADAASGIVDRLLGTGETVPLSTAGRSLVGADRALARTENETLRNERDDLSDSVGESTDAVEAAVDGVLRRQTELSRSERAESLRSARRQWNSTGELAGAMGTGDYAETVAAEAAARGSFSPADQEVLAARLRMTIEATANEGPATVSAAEVNRSASVLRTVARDELESAVESELRRGADAAADRWAPEAIGAVPAGAPVFPTPTHWYATVNVWTVEVSGAYPRFAVTAPRTGPPDEEFEYVREAGTATVELAGEPVALGRTEQVRFETGTVVVVAVPPGPPGVGDVDGTRDETSPGWPCPGATPDSLDGTTREASCDR